MTELSGVYGDILMVIKIIVGYFEQPDSQNKRTIVNVKIRLKKFYVCDLYSLIGSMAEISEIKCIFTGTLIRLR